MSLRFQIAAMCISLLVGCASLLHAAAITSSKWKIGAPIVTYWAGPGGTTPVTDQAVAQLAAGGWNLGWAATPADLDVYDRYGIRAMLVIGTPDLDDPHAAKALDVLISQVRNHPALYAYHLVDEPGSGAFPRLGKLVSHLRKLDPAHMAYINLLPTYASDGQLQVSDDEAEKAKVGYPQDFAGVNTDDMTSMRYREHLRRFVDIVKPDLISYDHYHFLKNSDGSQYFLNLSMIRKAAIEAKLPFLNIIQACDSPSEGWRGPNENEVRWLMNTTLAYGALGVSHFRYDTGLFRDPGELQQPLPLYWAVTKMNREFLAITTELQSLKSLGVYHCGTLPLGGEALPDSAPFTPSPRKQEVLLGYFGKSASHPSHVVVVNLDYKNSAEVEMTGPGQMEVFHAVTRTWRGKTVGSRVRLTLPPGGGALVRLSR